MNAKVLFITGDGMDETLWAIPLGDDLYKLDNSPWLAYGVSWQDIIEATPDENGGLPRFRKVIQKSGNRTLRLILDPPANQSPDAQKILDKITDMGCSYEGANPKFVAVNIPPAVNLRKICDFLSKKGCQWEHADPIYDEIQRR